MATPIARQNTDPKKNLKLIQAQVVELNQVIERFSDGNANAAKVINQKMAKLESQLTPDNLMLLRMKAYWLQKQGETEQALSAYHSILVLHPDDMQASLNIILLQLTMGFDQRALRRLDDLEDIYPDSVQVVRFKRQVMAHHGT